MNETVAIAVLVLFAGTLLLLLPFALHRTLLLLAARERRREARGAWPERRLPRVTIQLPVYNERTVVERLVDAACSVDYPRALLQIQVLDDSTDETSLRAARRVRAWRRRGVDAVHVRRGSRSGFKAGALAHGTALARGDFLLVLDADFVAPPDLVRRLLPPFRDESVGMVQARWDHLNEPESGLTRAQALLLDGHFFFEHGGRHARGLFFNFNGTAGMWRRRCLEEAGGWHADTLTEDLDLSYRAQMAGWRFAFLDDVGVPAEVPADVGALEVQQRRWAQGGIQTARKILPRLLRGPWSRRVKVEAVVHLCGHLAHPLTALLALLIFPAAMARRSLGLDHLLWADLPLFLAATGPFLLFYGTAGRRRGRPWRVVVPGVLRTLSLGIGLSVPVSRAVLRGLGSSREPFVRTPKRGSRSEVGYRSPGDPKDTAAKLLFGGTLLGYLALAVAGGYWAQIPFLILFASGYLWLGLPSLLGGFGVGATRSGLDGEEGEDRYPEEEPSPERLGPGAGLVVGA
jgi:cellulose synthase/poly-beta-1,6-N-acetylglucosamine synthase-like glycosyltransferase